jgi:hypothetical protein
MASLLIVLVFLPFALAAVVFWICMLVSAIQNKGLTDTERVIWVLVVILLHILGAFLYLFLGWPKRHTPLTTG